MLKHLLLLIIFNLNISYADTKDNLIKECENNHVELEKLVEHLDKLSNKSNEEKNTSKYLDELIDVLTKINKNINKSEKIMKKCIDNKDNKIDTTDII
jgi:hypothetical protein